MKKLRLILSLVIFIGLLSCNQGKVAENTINEEPENEWISLFNGKDLTGWRSFQSDTIGGWAVEDSCLTALGGGSDLSGDIVTVDQYDNFELYLEWKIAPEGNSGILYHVLEGVHKTTYETGPEYQVLDDLGFKEPVEDWQKTGANYAMHVPETKTLKPVGEFNTTRIIVDSTHVEHWLNGEKLIEYELWSDDWNKRVQEGKWKDYPDYGKAKKGHIALQDHGSRVWYRNIKLKDLNN